MRYVVYAIYVLQVLGLFLFCRGFFPHKKAVLAGHAQAGPDDVPALFDRLIFVVIDAWRSDFAFAETSSMHKLQDHVAQGSALAFTAKASTPTVTLPRLKCLTTGSITGFLDAILNIAESDSSSTMASQDSWPGQMQLAGRRIHMYGDDTWLRLFPGVFSTSEGTSSFFVSDFTEVDNNVTRHLNHELSHPQWDALILHYLGLDHIGHLEGPDSVHMPHKQREMDDILDKLYRESLIADERDGKKTLIVALGDHGMTGDGNHGGASEAEVYTAVAVMAKHFKDSKQAGSVRKKDMHDPFVFHDEMLQSDIVPALAMMLGLPIPQNSLGIIPSSILHAWTQPADRAKALSQNARQLQKLVAAGSFSDTEILGTSLPCATSAQDNACTMEQLSFDFGAVLGLETQAETYKVMAEMQGLLLSSSNDYSMTDIYTGLVLLGFATLATTHQVLVQSSTLDHFVVILMPILHAISAFASSFIEEEQVIWYYFTAFGLFYLSASNARKLRSWAGIAATISFRVLRRYNQTGQKYSGAPDISTMLQRIPHLDYSLIVMATIVLIVITATIRADFMSRSGLTLASLLLIGAKLSTLSIAYTTTCVRLIWLLLITMTINTYRSQICVSAVWKMAGAILFVLQSRPRNFAILLLFYGIDKSLERSSNIPWTISAFIALQQASFFALGNSNSLSGLDLSQAYNGVSEYNEGLVGLLLFISTFIGPIYWQISLTQWLSAHPRAAEAKDFAKRYMAFASCIYAFALCISCFILRHHLFVFSVFSPKLLFTAAWTLFYAVALLLT